MKAASELIEKTQERERGTPLLKDNNLPRRPIIIIALVCITSAILATTLFLYSSPHILSTTVIDLVKLVCIACLGSISTSVGIIFGDSLSHVFSFGLAVSNLHIFFYRWHLYYISNYRCTHFHLLFCCYSSYCSSTTTM